ncbi:hypothetical protein TSUD_114010, partial [Trifolium subterraneum]
RLLKMVDGLNFKDFVAFLSAFSTKASAHQKIEFIFKVYDSDRNGKVSFKDMLQVLKDLSGSYMSDEQREEVLGQVLKEAGYSKDCYLTLDDFTKVTTFSYIFLLENLKMDITKRNIKIILVLADSHIDKLSIWESPPNDLKELILADALRVAYPRA